MRQETGPSPWREAPTFSSSLGQAAFDLDLVVDSKNIPELNELTYDPDNGLTIGAAVPCYRIYGNSTVSSVYPGIVDAANIIGGTQIQGRASLGGNLCNAAPSADSVPAMIAYNGVARIAGPNGNREVALEDFCTFVRQTVLEPGEILVSLHFPDSRWLTRELTTSGSYPETKWTSPSRAPEYRSSWTTATLRRQG